MPDSATGLAASFVTVPVMAPPVAIAALMLAVVAPTVTETRLAAGKLDRDRGGARWARLVVEVLGHIVGGSATGELHQVGAAGEPEDAVAAAAVSLGVAKAGAL